MQSETNQADGRGVERTVFFSYSRADREDAKPIIAFLEQAGFPVWWDGLLEGGTDFVKHTETALEGAKAVIVLWSENSVGSHWVRDEATTGRERKRLIPLSLDGSLPPLGFRQIQAIDMRRWRQNDAARKQIINRLEVLHDRPLGSSNYVAGRMADAPAQGWSKRSLLIATGAGVLIGGAGIAYLARPVPTLGDIAVLPFDNRLGDEALDYLVEGLASSVRDGLSMNAALSVIGRSSSQDAKQTFTDTVSIAKALRARTVLEGRVERLGGEDNVTVSLLRGRTGLVEWTQSFPFNPNRVLELRDAMIQRILLSLSGRTEQESDRASVDPAAYDQYLRGRALLTRRATLERIEQARSHFERAVEIDPGFGLAHAELADQLLLLGVVSADKDQSVQLIDQAFASAEAAVQASPDIASTHVILGHVRMSARSDYKGAAEAYDVANRIGLRSTADIGRYAIFKAGMKETQGAIAAARRGVTLDPLNPTMREVLAYATYASGDYKKAAALYRDVLDMDPERFTVRAWLGLSEIYAGNLKAGIGICAEEENAMERLTCQAIGWHRLGDPAQAEQAFDQLVATFGDAAAYQQAQIHAQSGDLNQAMTTLELADALDDTGLSLLNIDPAMDPLRGRDDFQRLLARRGLSG